MKFNSHKVAVFDVIISICILDRIYKGATEIDRKSEPINAGTKIIKIVININKA